MLTQQIEAIDAILQGDDMTKQEILEALEIIAEQLHELNSRANPYPPMKNLIYIRDGKLSLWVHWNSLSVPLIDRI